MSLALLLPLLPGAAGGTPSADPDAIHSRIARILSRPEFGQNQGNLNWIWEAIRTFFEWLGGLSTTAPILFVILVGSLIAALVLLLTHITWTITRVFTYTPDAVAAQAAAEQRQRLSQAHRQEALARAALGEFTEAIRFLFLSLVYRFDEEGRVLFQRAYTNREYLTLFADRPRVNEDLRVFVDILDDHWYGQQPTDAGRYQKCLSLYERLRQQG
jgi:hypothetical protein